MQRLSRSQIGDIPMPNSASRSSAADHDADVAEGASKRSICRRLIEKQFEPSQRASAGADHCRSDWRVRDPGGRGVKPDEHGVRDRDLPVARQRRRLPGGQGRNDAGPDRLRSGPGARHRRAVRVHRGDAGRGVGELMARLRRRPGRRAASSRTGSRKRSTRAARSTCCAMASSIWASRSSSRTSGRRTG